MSSETAPSTLKPGKQYHHRLFGTTNTPLRSVLAFSALAGAAAAPIYATLPLSNILDSAILGEAPNLAKALGDTSLEWTPGFIAAGSLLPGLVIPASLAIERYIYEQPWGSICSIRNKFRWHWFRKLATRAVPITLVYSAVLHAFKPPGWPVLSYRALATSAAVVLTMPFGAAAEEFGVRGVINRVVSSWIQDPEHAFWASTALTSTVFASIHMSNNLLYNIYYLVSGVSTSLMTRWTGGLEASTLVHSLCNLALTLPLIAAQNNAALDDLAKGTGLGLLMLVPIEGAAVLTWLVNYMSKKEKIENGDEHKD